MPEYLYPGVYIEEIERGPRPIEGVPTNTAALLGETERGPLTPRMVTSSEDYARWFGGDFGPDEFLPHAIDGFFGNGGKRAFVARIVGQGATPAQIDLGAFVVRAAGPGAWGNRVFVSVGDGTTRDATNAPVGFRVRVAYWSGTAPGFDPFVETTRTPRPSLVEDFDDLVAGEALPSMDTSALIMLVRKEEAAGGALPTGTAGLLAGGADGAALQAVDYEGEPDGDRREAQGLAALKHHSCRDVALVYAPAVSSDVAKAIVAHCEAMRFRFAVIDVEAGTPSPSVLDPRSAIADSSYGAFYYPWVTIAHPAGGLRTLVPPGGHVLGVYARTDTERGVSKAPANEVLSGVLDLQVDMNDRMQDTLNPLGVNAIRRFPGRGIRVWGARTMSSNALWKYVSVRRLFIFLERSIYEGTQWVVFEPNDDRLWAKVVDQIRLFLRAQWRSGALFGRTEQEAFFITCDRTTMTQDDILSGRLICEIGIAPVRPAEFVIFRIFQHTAEA